MKKKLYLLTSTEDSSTELMPVMAYSHEEAYKWACENTEPGSFPDSSQTDPDDEDYDLDNYAWMEEQCIIELDFEAGDMNVYRWDGEWDLVETNKIKNP